MYVYTIPIYLLCKSTAFTGIPAHPRWVIATVYKVAQSTSFRSKGLSLSYKITQAEAHQRGKLVFERREVSQMF